MSNIIQDAPPIQQTGPAPITTEAPSDAWSYTKICYRPLPTNTFLDYRVRVDDSTMDFYYHQEKLPGASAGGMKWVCRQGITSADPNQQTEDPGANLYDTKYINSSQYDSQASDTCQNADSSSTYLVQLACGLNPDLPDPAKYVLWAIGGIGVILVLVIIFNLTR